MAPTLQQLRKMSKKELASNYDQESPNSLVNPQIYIDELNRRIITWQTRALIGFTIVIAILTVILVILTAVVAFSPSHNRLAA